MGPLFEQELYFSSTLNYTQSASLCCQPPVSGALLHCVGTTGAIRGSSQTLFGVGQCQVYAAITHP